MKLKQEWGILDFVQLVITVVTAAAALRLNYLQGELTRRVQREGITQTYAEKILGQLNNLKMDDIQRGTVVIDVLDIITEANLNVDERPYSDSERQQLIPLRLALATRDADLIAHIGTDKRRRKLWTDMAIQSGNDEIKRTAIRALAQIGRYRGRVAELETFTFCVEKILEISENFVREPLSKDAIEQFTVLVEVAAKVPILMEDDVLKALMQRGRDALIIAAGSALQERAQQQQRQPESAQPSPTPPSLKPASLPSEVPPGEANDLRLVAYQSDNAATASRSSARESDDSSMFLLAGSRIESTDLLNAAQRALRQVDDLNLKKTPARNPSGTPANDVISANIEALKSADVEKRRSARLDLARAGAANVPALLEVLRRDPDNYRLKVGISFALSKMTETARITKADDAEQLVRLAGDEEPDVRQYASEFLMRISDAKSVQTIRPLLEASIQREMKAVPPNGNAVYNAVVILGTWMRTLPPELTAEKSAIAKYLSELEPQLSKDNQWGKTFALVRELNAIGSDDKRINN